LLFVANKLSLSFFDRGTQLNHTYEILRPPMPSLMIYASVGKVHLFCDVDVIDLLISSQNLTSLSLSPTAPKLQMVNGQKRSARYRANQLLILHYIIKLFRVAKVKKTARSTMKVKKANLYSALL